MPNRKIQADMVAMVPGLRINEFVTSSAQTQISRLKILIFNLASIFTKMRFDHRYSSRSYTVLILPDSTLMKVGDVLMTRIAVGLESSTSELFKIGFMEYRDST